jgi:retron-type reverse transcriptase
LLTGLSLLDGKLPQGAPTSPQLANLVFLPCDGQIVNLAERHGVAYSRYADDLTFSADHPISPGFIGNVIRLIEGHSFRINQQKLRSAGPGQRLMTTGMVVNVTIHPVRRLRRQLRARFHQAEINPTQFTEQAHQLLGWAAYVNMYDRDLGSKYLSTAKSILYAARSKKG